MPLSERIKRARAIQQQPGLQTRTRTPIPSATNQPLSRTILDTVKGLPQATFKTYNPLVRDVGNVVKKTQNFMESLTPTPEEAKKQNLVPLGNVYVDPFGAVGAMEKVVASSVLSKLAKEVNPKSVIQELLKLGVKGKKAEEIAPIIAKSTDEKSISQTITDALSRERGFVTSAKEVVNTERIAGQYIPRETDPLAIKANNLIKDDIMTAERIALTESDDKAVAIASELLKKLGDDAVRTTDKLQADAIYERAAKIANTMAEKLTELGRSIQAASILGRLTPEGQVRFAAREIQKYNETARRKIPELTGEQTKQIIKEMKDIQEMPEGNAKGIAFKKLQDTIQAMVPSSLLQKIISIWKAGLLTGLKTSGLNILSNVSHSATEIAKDVPASAADMLMSLFTGKRTTAFTLRGLPEGVKEGAKKGFQYLKTGYDSRDIATKLDYKQVNFKNKALQGYVDTVFRALGAQDQIFYYGALRRSLYNQALAKAKNAGRGGDKLVEKHKEIFNYTDPSKPPMGVSKFYGQSMEDIGDYKEGRVLNSGFVDEEKLYKGGSSEGYLNSIKYDFNTKEPLIEKMTGGKLHSVNDLFGDEGDFPNFEFAATQQIAERELKKLGYGGAKWAQEDDLIPVQYQIWDKSIVKTKEEISDAAKKSVDIDHLAHNPTDEMSAYALADAETAVFQNKTKLGQAASAITRAVPGTEFIIPFARTPSAVAMQVVNYSPIGAFVEIGKQIARGKFDQRLLAQAIGRSSIGTGVVWTGGKLYEKGMMSLDYPKDERERELWKAEGRVPNSIKIGDKWRTVQSFGPAGPVMLIGGHFQRALKETGSHTEAMVTAFFGTIKSFTEQTFLKGVNDVISAITDPQRSARSVSASFVSSWIPTIINDIARATDPKERKVSAEAASKEVANRVVSRIPGFRKSLEPQVDVLGRERERAGNPLEVMLDPTRPSKDVSTPVTDELRRLMDGGFRVSPTLLGDRNGYAGLTPQQNTAMWKLSGGITNDKLTALFKSQQYLAMDDEERGKTIERFVTIATENSRVAAAIEATQGLSGDALKAKLSELKAGGLLTKPVFAKYLKLR